MERIAKLPYLDVIVANPLDEDVKFDAPVYSKEDLDEIRELGLIVEGIDGSEPLKDVLDRMKKRIQT